MTQSSSHPDPADRPAQPADQNTARLFAVAGRQAAPLAPDFLAELRERTTAEFEQAHQQRSTVAQLSSSRSWQMLIVRALAAAVATAAVFSALWFNHNPRGGRPTGPEWAELQRPALAETAFGKAFANLGSTTFAAELDANGNRQYVSGADNGQLRFDTEPGNYAIVHRDRQWNVDEGTNRAEPRLANYFYRRDDAAALNPWRMMQLEPEQGAALDYREQEVAANSEKLFTSYFNARYQGQPVAVEAQIDRAEQLPRKLFVWPRENRGVQPLLRFHLTQSGGPADATKFKVAETLTEDGRIGKIVDLQGLVTVRALASIRWTPLYGPNTLLVPGDWLRTDNLGANAATVQLAPQTKLIVGPGTLVELTKPDQLRMSTGVVQVTASEKTPVTLIGPDGGQVKIAGKEVWQVAGNKLQQLKTEPLWLKGYLGQATQETLGSLIAQVDGRNVALTVGYHKVLVEIRDQIARTTIEESFVNHTDGVLEGQFYFPLPQDASISGFGMWIGDKLVEADIVEKQRAREIYEQILREKKDPGLLEWTGGNIFKARIYPIAARSEKRIKITYTQVLPLVGDSFRYSYALQSDLLKQNPLRKLELAVNIQSTQPLQSVTSPTHPTRNPLAKSAHSNHLARLEFSAQDYTPTRDFEVVATLATRNQDLTFIPHQRGEDGYFMLLMQPPNQTGAWTRPLVNDGQPLELLILADTSASMDRAARTRQEEIVAALLGSLAPKDKFNLAVCDVDCIWSFEKSVDAAPEQITKARDALQRRRSMGWTNLQRGWESALKQASPGAHVIYIGDGIVTRGALDQAGDLQAIAAAARGKNVLGHAIAVSSTYESQILKAIAAVGGGSVWQAGGEVKPTQVAHDLLVEATRPSLRNIQVTFAGFSAAAVYPAVLSNLPVGTQQVVLGRYWPGTASDKGEVIVTGTMNGKPVPPFRAAVNLKEAPKAGSDDDASFIPRLWARLRLDDLLAQGSSQETQDQIIALSEEYHIITPYTSLLILESDDQRAQFKVKKRMQMRDGERFFQKSNNELRFALIQQQLEQAQAWRQQLRQRLLESLTSLGRDANLLEPRVEHEQLMRVMASSIQADSWMDYDGSAKGLNYWALWSKDGQHANRLSRGGPVAADWSGLGGLGGEFYNNSLAEVDLDQVHEPQGSLHFEQYDFRAGRKMYLGDELAAAVEFTDSTEMTGESLSRDVRFVEVQLGLSLGRYDGATMFGYDVDHGLQVETGEDAYLLTGLSSAGTERGTWDRRVSTKYLFDQAYAGFAPALYKGSRGFGYVQVSRQQLLPVPPPYHVPKHRTRKVATRWPAEAVELVRGLELADDLRKLAGGVLVDRTDESFRVRTGALTFRHEMRQLYSPKAWLTRGDRLRDSNPLLQWCSETERGNQSLAFDLALVRKSDENDLQFLPSLLNETGRWDESLADHQVKIERPAANRVLLIAKAEDTVLVSHDEHRWLIDTERRVVLESELRQQGKVFSRTVFGKFVQIAGRWLATTAEHIGAEGKRTGLVTLQLQELQPDQFRTAWDNEQKLRTPALTFQLPLPELADAEKHVAAGTATIADRLTLLARQYGRNQWTEATTQLAEGEKLAPGKAGWRWLRLTLLEESRRHEEAKQLLTQIGEKTIAQRHPAEFAIVHKLQEVSQRLTGGNEQLDLLAVLHRAYLRFAPPAEGEKEWEITQLAAFSTAGRADEHRDRLQQLAIKYPRDLSLQIPHVGQLRQSGEIAAALAWIEAALKTNGDHNSEWEQHELGQLRALYCEILESEGRYADAVAFARQWEQQLPDSLDADQRILAYLVLSGKEAEAFAQAEKWLQEFVPPPGKKLEGAAYNKVYAAVQILLGQGRNISQANLNQKYLPQLEKLLLQFAGTDDAHQIASLIWNENEFRGTPAGLRVLKTIFTRLVDNIATLSLDEIHRLCEIATWTTNTKEYEARWARIQTALERRWSTEPKLRLRTLYRELILRVTDMQYANHTALRERALRMFLAGARPAEKDGAVLDLFNFLLSQAWTAARETETLQLIDQMSAQASPAARLLSQVQALYRWTDTLESLRGAFLINQIPRPDQMKREDLDKKHEQLRKQAREDISARLAATAAARKYKNDPLARWILLEQRTLEIRLERKLPQVADQLWSWLQQSLDLPAPAIDDDDEDSDQFILIRLEDAWQHRLLKSLLHLAARKDAPAEHVARLRKLFEAEQKLRAAQLANPDQAARRAPNHLDWQQLQYDLLLARDLPKELQQLLENFKTLNDDTGRWRRLLARVYAELNKLEAAVQLLEELQRADLLASEDYRSLATWYHALDQRAKHEAAQVQVYRFLQPWPLHQQIMQHLNRWRRSGSLPEKVDPNVLLMFAALLQTEESPSYYLVNSLLPFYEATHDTRLLHVMAKALPGHTAERVYPMLKETWNILSRVEHEATIDELIEGLAEVRKTVTTPLDERALDLLEALAYRRAAELQNGAQPHVQAALAALQRAEKRAWRTGELQQMADFLASLGVIAQPALAAEQVRLLEQLVPQAQPGTDAALHIQSSLAATEWNYGRQRRALDLQTAAVEPYRQAQAGKVTQGALSYWFRIVDWQTELQQFVAAERLLDNLQAQAANATLAQRVIHRRYGLYSVALQQQGLTTLGRGEALYRAALAAARKDAEEHPDLNFLIELGNQTIQLFRAAHAVKIATAAQDLIAYSKADFTQVLHRQVNGYDSSVEQMAQTLKDVAGAKAAIGFLLDRAENEPVWVRYQGNNAWNRHAYRIAQWRAEEPKPDLGKLEPRLLRFVIAELKRDLTNRSSQNRYMYGEYNWFWKEKADAFAAAAEEVLKEHRDSSHSAMYIGEYFYHGLQRRDRGLEIMLDAHARKLLDDSQQVRLVHLLHNAGRYAESIPLLEALVARWPLHLAYRCDLMRAYFHAKRFQTLAELHKKTFDLHQVENRWTEDAMEILGTACLDCELFEPAVDYLNQSIAAHLKRTNGRTMRDQAASRKYQALARSYAGLKNTKSAVDAAASAIICWPRQQDQRNEALRILRAVLAASPDQRAYVKQLDLETKEQDRPIIRKALAQVFHEKGMLPEAITQYRAAVQLAPNDAELHANLIECFDAQNDQAGAIAQSFDSLELNRRNFELWRQLAKRFDAANDANAAERARTSLAEIAPGETEGIELLATEREQQQRWEAALEQWQQVAKLRKLEPKGLVNLARVQLQLKQKEAAAATIKQLESTTWPPHTQKDLEQLPKLKIQLQ